MMVSHPQRLSLRFLLSLCASLTGSLACAEESNEEKITFTKHIAPILWQHCVDCHRPGQVGPFPLFTYQDAVKRASFIKQTTHDRRMPPWKAEPGVLAFQDERRLSAEQLALIARWVDSGAPEGDPADLPTPPEFHEGWQLGEPDLVLQMKEPFPIPADGRDVYRCFVIPIPCDEDRMVSAVEFRPGNRAVVHHTIMFLDANGAARKLDGQDGQPGYRSFGGAGVKATGGLGAWLPGTVPRHLPEGMAKYVKGGSDLVLQVHYHPSGKPETDQSSVGIYFAKKPAEKIVTGIAVTQPLLRLPAGKARCDVKTRCQPLPVDVNVLGISPHMHDLGREFKVMAHLPGGEHLPLIWIKDWDFNWQGTYQFAKPVRLPKGSVICLHAIYDNSADNPKNPHTPPREVTWGEQATDEMCLCGVQVFTDNPSDLAAISKMPGYELAVGLEGGIPHETEHQTTSDTRGGYPADGIPIFSDKVRQLLPFDRDKNGSLSRRELSKMSGPMQMYILRRYYETRRQDAQ
jgi:hypothetical protein